MKSRGVGFLKRSKNLMNILSESGSVGLVSEDGGNSLVLEEAERSGLVHNDFINFIMVDTTAA